MKNNYTEEDMARPKGWQEKPTATELILAVACIVLVIGGVIILWSIFGSTPMPGVIIPAL